MTGGLPGTPCGYSSGAADATVSAVRNLAPAPLANARAAACHAAEGQISPVRAHVRDNPGIFFISPEKMGSCGKRLFLNEHVLHKVGTVVIDKTQPEKDNALVMNRFVNRRQLMQQGAVHVFRNSSCIMDQLTHKRRIL